MTQLTHLLAQPPEMERLTATLDQALSDLSALAGRLGGDYPATLAASWEGEAHNRFVQSLKETETTLAGLRKEYEALAHLLRDAAAGYSTAESEALRLAGLEVRA